jgi:hypothetical protein
MAREEVEVELSGALFDGDPRGFIDHIGLHGRPLGNNRWAVWPTNDKAFISHRGLADQTQFANRFDHLNQVPVTGTHLADDPELLTRFAELESQLADRLSGKADIAAVFYRIQTNVVKCTTSEELVTVVQQAYDQLGTVGLEWESSSFPTAPRTLSSLPTCSSDELGCRQSCSGSTRIRTHWTRSPISEMKADTSHRRPIGFMGLSEHPMISGRSWVYESRLLVRSHRPPAYCNSLQPRQRDCWSTTLSYGTDAAAAWTRPR